MKSLKNVSVKFFLTFLPAKLKEEYTKNEIFVPQWAELVKTGAGKERKPIEKDWWFIRAASILKKLFIFSNIGVQKLSRKYSSLKNRGCKPERKVPSGRKHLRLILQNFEKLNLVTKDKKGRMISDNGKKTLSSWIKLFENEQK